jgi:hypothetical protein
MGWVVIDPVNGCFDGFYYTQEAAYVAQDKLAAHFNEPMIYTVVYDGPINDLYEAYDLMEHTEYSGDVHNITIGDLTSRLREIYRTNTSLKYKPIVSIGDSTT